MVPFSLFVSLSASDNVLPTMGSEEPSVGSAGRNKRPGMVKVAVDTVLDAIGQLSRKMGWSRAERDF